MIVLNYTLTVVATKVEKRLRASRKGGGPKGGAVPELPAVSVPGMDITDKRL